VAPVTACSNPFPAATQISPNSPQQLDSILFDAVVKELMNEMIGSVRIEPPRVDPRPLVGRADLLSVRFKNTADSTQWRPGVFADSDTSVLRARRDILAKAGATEDNAFSHMRCPGGLLPYVEPHITELREHCPREALGIAVIALPRENGAYAPGAVDDRAKYHGRDIYSVRVIETTLHPMGTWEAVSDYVFERVEGSRFVFLERFLLMSAP